MTNISIKALHETAFDALNSIYIEAMERSQATEEMGLEAARNEYRIAGDAIASSFKDETAVAYGILRAMLGATQLDFEDQTATNRKAVAAAHEKFCRAKLAEEEAYKQHWQRAQSRELLHNAMATEISTVLCQTLGPDDSSAAAVVQSVQRERHAKARQTWNDACNAGHRAMQKGIEEARKEFNETTRTLCVAMDEVIKAYNAIFSAIPEPIRISAQENAARAIEKRTAARKDLDAHYSEQTKELFRRSKEEQSVRVLAFIELEVAFKKFSIVANPTMTMDDINV